MNVGEPTEVLIYIYHKVIDLLLVQLEIIPNVTIGWVIIGVFLISMLISSILSRPISPGALRYIRRSERSENKGGEKK